jgi:predicted GNAT family acetyltransferase
MSPRSGGGRSRRDFHARAFNPGRWQIITAGGAGIGMLDVEYRPAEIYLARIEIHPDHQGGGIGTRLISALIDEAGRKGQDLVLDALTVNRRAQAAWIATVNPASARQIALVSPLTPAPITNASSLGVLTRETCPLPARSSPAGRRPRYRRAAPAPPQRVASV